MKALLGLLLLHIGLEREARWTTYRLHQAAISLPHAVVVRSSSMLEGRIVHILGMPSDIMPKTINFHTSYTFGMKLIIYYSDSQAARKALESNCFKSRAVWNCRETLNRLAQRNKVNLVWIPGHTGLERNEIADALAKGGVAITFTGPESGESSCPNVAAQKSESNMVICVETGLDNVPFIQLGCHQMRLDLEELIGKDKLRAEKELRETPENIEFGLTKLQDILRADQGLNVPFEDEAFLLKFLRPCRYIPEIAAKIIRKFYRFKLKHPKYGINISPHNVRHVFDNEVYKFFPVRTSSGARIMIVSLANWNPKEVTMEDMFKALMVSIEIAMLEPKTQLGGVQVIIDLAGLSLIHIYQFSPHIAKLILDWVQDCNPARLKGIHLINQSTLFSMGFAIFKPFFGDRLKKLIFIHGDKKSLTERVSPESLPEYYGGTADFPDYPGSVFSDMLFFYEKDFEVLQAYGYVSKKVKAHRK